ncbi:hypothetical protein KIL84_010623 [Mauremys mutica]|uniref:Uncharacterized protein n=1 Tax=Mauremys mutica TaxID=74926 RepID=A0A9D3XC75_9SAUR|nr:hypothetical protein KIL84_010623 [Mauremys mutica]
MDMTCSTNFIGTNHMHNSCPILEFTNLKWWDINPNKDGVKFSLFLNTLEWSLSTGGCCCHLQVVSCTGFTVIERVQGIYINEKIFPQTIGTQMGSYSKYPLRKTW